MPLLSDADSLVKKTKMCSFWCNVWLNALRATLPSLNIECSGWKVRRNYNGVTMWFSGNQVPPSMANSNETDMQKKSSLKYKQINPQITTIVTQNKKVDSNKETENTNVDLNTSKYPEESISTYRIVMNLDGKVIFFHRYYTA